MKVIDVFPHRFNIYMVIGDKNTAFPDISIADIEEMSEQGDIEVAHCMVEEMESLIKMQPGQSIFMHASRDNKNHKAIVVRVK